MEYITIQERNAVDADATLVHKDPESDALRGVIKLHRRTDAPNQPAGPQGRISFLTQVKHRLRTPP